MFSRFLNRNPIHGPAPLAFEFIAMLLVVGLADWWSGYELSFSLFYLGPVGYVSWRGGWQAGVLAAMTGTAVWRLADFWAGATYSHPLVAIWNVGIRFGVFLGVALLLDRLRRLLDREQTLARLDALTGLANARRFREEAAEEIERSLRYGRPLVIAYLDLDDFKRLNDIEGHAAGDMALRRIGGVINREIRRTDHAARLGGDEFAVLMPETGVQEAATILDRLRTALLVTMVDHKWPIGVSIGAVGFEHPPSSVDELLQAADRLMYSVKESGKGAVRVDPGGSRRRQTTQSR